MNLLLFQLSLLMNLTEFKPLMVFDFNKKCDLSNWYIVDDVVMGGRSSGFLEVDRDGHGVFDGKISLRNNGGFSSLRYQFKKKKVQDYEKLLIYVKGDGKKYQIRIKENINDYFSYIAKIKTTKSWETIEVDLKSMYPVFRGRRLNQSNFSGKYLQEVGILIGNKKAENFKLTIDKIELK